MKSGAIEFRIFLKEANAHARIDAINEAQDRLIAARLRRDPKVLKVAKGNLRRWMRRDGRQPRKVFREWNTILERLTQAEIAVFLVSNTPMCKRLRQSSPFLGILSEVELERIKRRYAKE